MIAEVARTFTFEAAHQLPNHNGKCRHLHGHGYRVELAVEGVIRPADGTPTEGMVVDFAELADVEERVKHELDHALLNDVLASPPTAENVAVWIGTQARQFLDLPIRVTVWETAKCRATVRFQ